MSGTSGKNINLCFTKIRRPASPPSSIPEDHSRPFFSSATSSLIRNFNSLYDFTLECTPNSKFFAHSPTSSSTIDNDISDSDSEADTSPPPDLTTVFASKRFFFSSPGRSNSIIDSASVSSSLASTSSSSPPPQPESDTSVGDSIAIPTYSPDPFADFRRSMQEMVEARNLIDVRANWDYLHELLMCYLALNPKSTHKFIIGAFADLLVSLMASSTESAPRKSRFSGGSCSVSRRRCL